MIAIIEKLFAPGPGNGHASESVFAESLDVIRLMRSAGGALSAQAALHGQLARVEWEEEKSRLLQIAAMMLIAYMCALCMMIFLGVLVLALSWDTAYRIHACVGILVVYAIVIAIVVHRLQTLFARSRYAFAATREELAADIALIKSKL